MFHVGDIVIIKRGADGPRANLYLWSPIKDKYIGKKGTISSSSTVSGYWCVDFPDKTGCFFYQSCFEQSITSPPNNQNTQWAVPRDPAVKSKHHNFVPGDRVRYIILNLNGTVGNWINPDPKPKTSDSFFDNGVSVPVLFDNGAKQNMAYHPYYVCASSDLELTTEQMINKSTIIQKKNDVYCSCGGPRKKSHTGLAGNGTEFEICISCKKEADPDDILPF